METKHNELYEAPKIDILAVKNEGVVCASGMNSRGDYVEDDSNPFA